MEEVKVSSPLHNHLLIPFTRFDFSECEGCRSSSKDCIYGGYRCNKSWCDNTVFHKECANPLPEINNSSHPDHPLKLIILDSKEPSTCSFCTEEFRFGYCCSICEFKLDLKCARKPVPFLVLEKSNAHEHPVELFHEAEAYHTSHPQHPLKSLKCQVPDYADKKCLLCKEAFDQNHHQLHHCDVCNFSICNGCMRNPPPLRVESPKTHQHHLRLLSRLIDFTCNSCGTKGDRSPYFCRKCNFMIHRECIDLPRVINTNRHNHRISYTPCLGHGEWKCGVCRIKVDGFYGAYSCSRCPSFAVHSRCATRKDVWDMVELEGKPEEEEIAPFQVIDETTIRHFSHFSHNLRINKDGTILHESILCKGCAFQICAEPFYSCEQCDFVLHEKCANLPRKKRHVRDNQPFTLVTSSQFEIAKCILCFQFFTSFRYQYGTYKAVDVRCSSISEPFAHGSHPHLLYHTKDYSKHCGECGEIGMLSCDECDYILDYECALLPQKVMMDMYHNHHISLSYGESSADGEYWCEACETKVNPNKWFYACKDCSIILHISCVVGDISYIMPGSVTHSDEQVVSNMAQHKFSNRNSLIL